jgi:hypothetical protein
MSMTEFTMPLLLAGPIIRRVDKTQVCIWIATSKPVYTKVQIFNSKRSNIGFVPGKDANENNDKDLGPDFSQNGMNVIGRGNTTSLKLGDNLYVSLIKAKPLPSNGPIGSNTPNLISNFPTDEIRAYDMELFLSKEIKVKGLRL